MDWFDETDGSGPVISPQVEIDGFLRKRQPIPGFGVREHFLMLQTAGDIPGLRHYAQVDEESFPLPAVLGKRPLYAVQGAPSVSLVEKALGAPAAADALEVAVAMGARNLFFFGLCGAVGEAVEIGDVIIPERVKREEGTSYHYLPPEPDALPDARLVQKLDSFFRRRGALRVHTGATVSTDAVFRQTLQKERCWRKQGILGVDMEMSALLAVAEFRRLPAVGLLVVSDKHVLEDEGAWHWGGQDLALSRVRTLTLLIEFIQKQGAQEDRRNRNP